MYLPWNNLVHLLPHGWTEIFCSFVEYDQLFPEPSPLICSIFEGYHRAKIEVIKLVIVFRFSSIYLFVVSDYNRKSRCNSSFGKINLQLHTLDLKDIDFSSAGIHVERHLEHT